MLVAALVYTIFVVVSSVHLVVEPSVLGTVAIPIASEPMAPLYMQTYKNRT